MVRRRDDGDQDPRRVGEGEQYIEESPRLRLAPLAWLEGFAQHAGVVHHRASDEERISEMHRGHGGERVDVVAFHPDALSVVVADGVQEAVFLRQEPGWHARVADEDNKGKEIRECHGSSDDSECVM